MSQPTIHNVAQSVVEQYQSAGQALAQACHGRLRHEGGRLHQRVTALVEGGSSPLLDEAFKFSLLDIESRAWNLFDRAVAYSAERSDEMALRLAQDARRGIEQLASVGGLADATIEGSPSEVLNTLALPGAQLSLVLARKLAQGAQSLSARIAGLAGEADEPAAAVPAVRRARRTRH